MSSPTRRLWTCFIDDAFLPLACGAIVIAGRIGRVTAKYASRGLLYTVLEAGHAAQNIHLAAVHQGVGTVEVGGVLTDKLSRLLRLDSADRG